MREPILYGGGVEYYGGPADGKHELRNLPTNAVVQFWFYEECYIYRFDGTRLVFVEKSRV